MEPRRASWVSPVQVQLFHQAVWQKLERNPSVIHVPEGMPPISYYNNYKKHTLRFSADAFLNPEQGWDQRVLRSDRRYQGDIRESIFQEEKNKTVPVLTSMQYGRPCRRRLESPTRTYCRSEATRDFRTAKGTNMAPDLQQALQQRTRPTK